MSNKWLVRVLEGVIVGFAIGVTIKNYTANKIPQTDKVQQGYVIPSKLEIALRDSDRNGQKEVLMRYDGENYFLTLDEQGKPRVQTYKPVEVLRKE